MTAKPLSLIEREQITVRRYSWLLLAVTFSGLITWFVTPDNSIVMLAEQWTILFHVLAGACFSLVLIPYLWLHFKRTLGVRRPMVLFSGLMLGVLCLVLAISGITLAIRGQEERFAWIFDSHVISTFAFLFLLVFHILYHRFVDAKKKSSAPTDFFPSLAQLNSIHIFLPLLITIIVITACAIYFARNPTSYSSDPVVKNYSHSYGDHPFRPSQTETWNNKFIDQRQIANSDDCGSCHSEIFQQWKSSAHSQAASDKTYVTNVSLLSEKKGIDATRYCEGCHAPVALLAGQLSEGGDHGGKVNTVANLEGVSCLGCHGINKAVHLKGVASYEYKPPLDYLFAGQDSKLLNQMRHLLIRMQPAQHVRDMGRPILRQPEHCATCHVQFMDKDMNSWGWVKMQDDYTAWLESPYSQQNHPNFAKSEPTRCQDCHMPTVQANDPAANAAGMVRAHYFPGANTMLPVINNDKVQFERTKEFLQNDKVRITIDEPRRQDAAQTLDVLNEGLRATEETPYYYYLGETATIRVIVNNNGVGHNFPGGTLDINEAWVSFTATDAEGQVLFNSGFIQEDNSLDPKAHMYRSWPVDKKGELVWKHDMFNHIGEAFKNVIPAGQSDFIEYKFRVPSSTKGPITLSTAVKYRKLNDKYARWALKDKYQPLPIIDMARTSMVIPVKLKPKTTSRKTGK